jgi:glycosyltransferase involved in cell wall biosynthesis
MSARELKQEDSMAPIYILIDSSGIGGIERHVATLTKGLRTRGYDARILLFRDHGQNSWLLQLDNANLPYEFLNGGVGQLVTTLRTNRAALLHTHGYKAGILGRIAAKFSDVPIVSTFHAGETAPFPVSAYQLLDEMTSFLAKRIAVSVPIAKRLPFSSAHIPNFISTPDAAPEIPLSNTIGFVGRLSPEKGPDIFCNVAAAQSVDASWEICGDGPMRADLERLHGSMVTFRGMVTDMAPVWNRLGLLVISSHAEGLPMAALEALAAGIPIAASAVGALPDLIQHGQNGWLFDAGDTEALSRIVKDWADRREAEGINWRRNAWRTVHDSYGLQAGIDKTLAVYRDAGYRAGSDFSKIAISQSSFG